MKRPRERARLRLYGAMKLKNNYPTPKKPPHQHTSPVPSGTRLGLTCKFNSRMLFAQFHLGMHAAGTDTGTGRCVANVRFHTDSTLLFTVFSPFLSA